MRPAGEIRVALVEALQSTGRATSRTLAERACVGMAAASKTLDNLVSAGKVIKRPPVRVPGVKRPVPTYELYSPALWQQQPLQLERRA